MITKFIKLEWPSGSAYVRPSEVVAITDMVQDNAGVVPGHCVLMLTGGGALAIPLSKDTAREKLEDPGLKLAA